MGLRVTRVTCGPSGKSSPFGAGSGESRQAGVLWIPSSTQSRPEPLGKGVDAEHLLINKPAALAGPAAHDHGWQAGAAVTMGPGGCMLHREVKPSSEVQF